MWADDTNFTLSPTVKSILASTEDFDQFSRISGLKPNFDKCTIKCIGSLKHLQLPVNFPVRCTKGSVNIMGKCIPDKLSDITKINFESKVSGLYHVDDDYLLN